jgi:hypothetical protein
LICQHCAQQGSPSNEGLFVHIFPFNSMSTYASR